ncbi:MAG: transposase [Microcystaceae cyanobacterium]
MLKSSESVCQRLLDSWIQHALHSSLSSFVSYARGLVDDYAAVRAGVSVDWSNGQVEGQINRLKMLKRQMYGRASLPLLRRRFLLAC